MSNAVLKDPSLEEYYQALFGMYAAPGWQKLMEDAGRMRETHDSLNGVDSAEGLWFRKGQLQMIEWLLSHRFTVEAAYASLLAEQEGDDTLLTSTTGRAQVIE